VPLAGNLTTVSITDDDLKDRVPYLTSRYLPTGASDFSDQRTKATAEALADFESFTGRDPERCKARNDDKWKQILSLRTLVMIMEASTDDRSNILLERFHEIEKREFQNFQYDWDADEDDALSESEMDLSRRVQEIRIRR
jgi:hypothetical protein